MTDQHPIIPPSELVQRWRAAASNVPATLSTQTEPRRDYIDYIATAAAQWGADQELEACLEWVSSELRGQLRPAHRIVDDLRAARRPKPPTLKELKEQALAAAARFYAKGHEDCTEQEVRDDYDTLCRALKALPND